MKVETPGGRTSVAKGASKRTRRALVALGCVYAAWSIVALLEVALRASGKRDALPGFLSNHNGNIAVSGFIMAAAYPAAYIENLAASRGRPRWAACGRALVPIAGALWGAFFILMEILPAYAPNTVDVADIPGSVFGMICGVVFGARLKTSLVSGRPTGRSRRAA